LLTSRNRSLDPEEPRILRQWRNIVHNYGGETNLTSSILDQPGEDPTRSQRSLEETAWCRRMADL